MPGGIRAAARAKTPSGSPQLRDPDSTGPMSPGRLNTAGRNAAGNESPRATASPPPSYRGQPHVALRSSMTDPLIRRSLPVIQSGCVYLVLDRPERWDISGHREVNKSLSPSLASTREAKPQVLAVRVDTVE